MTVYHDEVEIEDFEYDKDDEVFTYPCPCGDEFVISMQDLLEGLDEATCPSCSLVVKVIYCREKFLKEHDLESMIGNLSISSEKEKVCN